MNVRYKGIRVLGSRACAGPAELNTTTTALIICNHIRWRITSRCRWLARMADACLQHALTCSMQPTADPRICLCTTNLYPND
ncbi:hypothetical protein EVAR_33087_1 [Eumeta japonica]|uniref:Uncharacterized protein n=1 Tax=Eumeta variegata TaxID=151549 RepID=A0A4C1Y8V6_EUMVA|nr:hypothetical protein EVAR_33087_1 [Eumeta japonica]